METRGVHVLALDLEGTLISNAVSVFPRPGLREFLGRCEALFPRVVIMTSVPSERARWVCALLASEGDAPGWFGRAEIVSWEGERKDLGWISGLEAPEEALLVDDQEAYVVGAQRGSWVPVRSWDAPYDAGDRELERVIEVLEEAALRSRP